ncbi:2-keto-4-pentenoate hydratase [Sphingomonas sp. LaA6.9]|uniref:2-keto-4-pentenoate hydratase n=1 Tax=Sphingomonas sp. LaA6.9 TaxID=2919914 RepID=UPI001F4F9089|nr:fumarylacetoacetate hydrolase family protein [Sphingomonas sp. LaA6.9]MCJ8159010.1 fumarylacetoacetate hydrolase family protein [Sphingomonas sp. LaA6.9]
MREALPLNADHQALARRLRDAYEREAISPLRDGLHPNDVAAAYAIQDANTAFWKTQGRRIVGRKVGLTGEAIQRQLGAEAPDLGVLFEDMRVADGGDLSPRRLIQPRAEGEIALILGRDVPGEETSPADMLAAAECAVAAIEIVDSRIADWKISLADTIADNASSAFFVLGKERKALTGLDLFSCGMVLELNGKVASLGAGAACLGHPLAAAAWAARALVAGGEPLKAGDIVLTGALGPMVPIAPGMDVLVHIGGLGRAGFHLG